MARGPTLDGSDPARLLASLLRPEGLVVRTGSALDVGSRLSVGVRLPGTRELLPVEVVVVGTGTPAAWPTVRVRLAPGGGPGVRVLSALAEGTEGQAVARATAAAFSAGRPVRTAVLPDSAALHTEVLRLVQRRPARLSLDLPIEAGVAFDCVLGTRRWPGLVRFRALVDGEEATARGPRALVLAPEDGCRKRLLRFLVRLGVTTDPAASRRAS